MTQATSDSLPLDRGLVSKIHNLSLISQLPVLTRLKTFQMYLTVSLFEH